jgi:hypothetical protein
MPPLTPASLSTAAIVDGCFFFVPRSPILYSKTAEKTCFLGVTLPGGPLSGARGEDVL